MNNISLYQGTIPGGGGGGALPYKRLRDGPLENLCGGGGGGGRAKYKKKYSRKGKLNEKKFMHAN